MSARTHTRSTQPATGRADFRLPWWGVALPTVAFVVLLVLITGSHDAEAASGDSSISHLMDRIQHSLSR
ncbi:hypothetical protein [Streptomyces sp. TLI_146]|uniref:hypothetical protein n=1 Tax=Streptomyces TaxID=1883 RepID=UPI000C7086FD|nr:hypothetical protein [Streptomyces sp. TLI_146]PKV84979.1 hypothetical protein BX283_2514 [Streptomyces sp. TLI_146]